MKRIALIVLTILSPLTTHLSPVSAQTEVTNFVPGSTLDGVNYFLPQTALRVTVVAEKNVTTPGELNKYAFRYLRLQDVPVSSSTAWAIKSITVEPYGVPDHHKAYNVKVKSKTVAPLVALTHDGILLAINTDCEEEALPELPHSVPAPAPQNPRQYMNQEILTAGSTAKMAELCAQEIYDIRDSRNALVRGEADNTPKDGQQLKLMLDQLATQEQALTQLFSGFTQTSSEVFSFTFLPTQETDKAILFRFSQMEGVVDSDDLSGQPIYISIKNTGNLPQRTESPETDKKKAKLERGIYYNVPAREAISIFDINQSYASIECSMGQFGYTEILSNVLFDKKMTTKVLFYQENGGVKKLEQ
ncbi:MAG: DUF4831 family protein [Bacteroidaceae bacterium]|nr:DUF4831 family protein [Bacteroidaceae bacterium]